MSRALAAAPTAPQQRPERASRPTPLDFFFLLAGASLSLCLARLVPLRELEVNPAALDERLRAAAALLPDALRLPEGILLLWPLFFLPQRLFGRSQGLTTGEWLWVLSWFGVALLTALDAVKYFDALPEGFAAYASKPRLFWYSIFVPATAALATLLLLVGVLRRQAPPWTNSLGLVLVIWPALPLAAILALRSLK
jgi:hypothetical protein